MSSRVRYTSQIRDISLLQLFFDFYVLNEVWFRTQGAVHYGYPLTKVLPARKEQAIDETFRQKVAVLKEQVIAALEASVRREIRHWSDEVRTWVGGEQDDDEGYGYQCDVIAGTSFYDRANKRFGLKRYAAGSTLAKLPLTTIRELYFVKCWCSSYGGPKWGQATDLLIKLKEAKTFKDEIFLLDRIFDLQHNTGFVLNKTNFAILDDRSYTRRRAKNGRSYAVKPLNFRFLARVDEMVEFCSYYVKGLYFANKNYLAA